MSRDESHHPRLLLLHESDGRIEGRAKYHKLLFKYGEEREGDTSLTFVSEERGPYDPGLSRAMRKYLDLELVDVDESDEPHEIAETEKGERYMSGYERTKARLDDAFNETKEKIERVVSDHGDRSANEIVEDEDVQEAKENPLRKYLD